MSSYVHVKPHVVLLTDVCNLIDGIERSIDRGAGGGIHKHWHISLQTKSIRKNICFSSGLDSNCNVLSPFVIVDIKETG